MASGQVLGEGPAQLNRNLYRITKKHSGWIDHGVINRGSVEEDHIRKGEEGSGAEVERVDSC